MTSKTIMTLDETLEQHSALGHEQVRAPNQHGGIRILAEEDHSRSRKTTSVAAPRREQPCSIQSSSGVTCAMQSRLWPVPVG